MDNRTEIEDILHQMELRRVYFVPSKKDLIKKIFYKNCTYLEDLGVDPCLDTLSLKICIKADLVKLLETVDSVYNVSTQNIYMRSRYVWN